jgi:hypothetical protein
MGNMRVVLVWGAPPPAASFLSLPWEHNNLPSRVLHWLVEAAEQLRAFPAYFLYELEITQV